MHSFLALLLPFAIAPPPAVHVSNGTLVGTLQSNNNISVFQGIPFAAPPVGNLRWREPQPASNWSGTRDATRPASPCSQSSASLDAYIAPLAATYQTPFQVQAHPSTEDCLYLNVFAPWPPAQTHGLPVMVWLHGGSNRSGTGADAGYHGSSLAAHGVIVLTINYRLGVMGFFAHPQLTAESPHHASGNYGLLDQIAALQWVQQNIAQFGGNPANVTIFGESAGSIDATTLMASPLSKGLFHRVIAESGPAFGLGRPQTLTAAQEVGAALSPSIETLRQMPADQVAVLDLSTIAARFKAFDPNGSIVDGWVLPQSAAQAFASGKIQKVDLLAGLNGRELSAFRIEAAAAAAKKQFKPDPATAAISKLADIAHPLYGGWTDMAIAFYLAQIVMHGDIALDRASNDILMACPIGAEATLVNSAGSRAFVYQFNRSIPGKGESKLGAFHGLEIPFVFNTFTDRSWRWLPFTESDKKLSAIIETYWTNFAKSGDPNSPGLPTWKQWNNNDELFLEFTQTGTALPQQSFSPPFCHLSPNSLQARLGSN